MRVFVCVCVCVCVCVPVCVLPGDCALQCMSIFAIVIAVRLLFSEYYFGLYVELRLVFECSYPAN